MYLSVSVNKSLKKKSDWAIFWYHDCSIIWKRVVIMTHQNLRLGKCWKPFWAPLNEIFCIPKTQNVASSYKHSLNWLHWQLQVLLCTYIHLQSEEQNNKIILEVQMVSLSNSIRVCNRIEVAVLHLRCVCVSK